MAKEKAVRLLDVARRAGVGVGTASRVLNNESSVSEERRRRVLKAIEELDYRPNAIARSLKVSRTKTLGVIIPDVSNEFYSEIVRGAEDAARGEHYNILLCSTDGRSEKEGHAVAMLSEKLVDGIIMLSYDLSGELLSSLHEADIPVALISTLLEEDAFITVNISNLEASQQAVEYLLGLGHRRIAMIAGPEHDRDGGENRLSGYRAALEGSGIGYDPLLVERSGGYTYEMGCRCMRRLLERDTGLTAVFAASDHLAMGCIRALWDQGLRVPEDVSVMGFDNLSITNYSVPPVTTVDQPRYEMGRLSAEKICQILDGQTVEERHFVLAHSIVHRSSTAAPPAQ